MSALVRDLRKGVEWVDTSVYGPHISSDRNDFSAELNIVAGKWDRPWVVGGDFNAIRFCNENHVSSLIGLMMWDLSD